MGGLFSFIGNLALSLFGGKNSQPTSGQSLAGTLIDKILPETEKEKQAAIIAEMDAEIRVQEEDIKDVESARNYNAPDMPVVQYQPGMGIIPFFLLWLLDLINHVVDTINHIIRPGFFIYLIGGFSNKWKLPDPKTIDPQLWTIFLVVVTFYFGARTLVKDLPTAINAIRNLRK